jgi:hypothetical protein
MKKSIIFFITVFSFFFGNSQTIIENKTQLQGTWTLAYSPYLINGEAIVPEGDSLIIDPGVEVKFKTGTDITHSGDDSVNVGYFNVKGKLIARGTPTQKIMFTRQGEEGNWGCIFIVSTDNSVFEYCTIQYANKLDSYSGAVNIYTPNTKLLNTSVINNKNRGISTEQVWNDPSTRGGSTPDIRNCIIANNLGSGLLLYYAYKADTVKMINNTITGNGGAGLATWGVRCQVTNCIFWSNNKSLSCSNARVILTYSLVQEDILSEPPDWVTFGDGVIYNFNPQLKSDYSLLFNSPCINAGVPNVSGLNLPIHDIAGNKRVNLGRIDMGALESTADKFICLRKPNGGEGYQAGKNVYITWKSNATNVKLEYTDDGGGTWENITVSAPNDSLFSWLIPAVESDSFNIRISDYTDNTIFDTCDRNLTIFTSAIPDSTNLAGRLTIEHSPYYLNGKIFVPFGDSLIIDPGVVLKFKVNTGSLGVYGKLIAKGTCEMPITFTRQGDEGHWGSVALLNTVINSFMEYCTIQYASGSVTLGGAIRNFNPRLILSHSTIINNKGNGVYSEESYPEIRNCIIAFNHGSGIYLLDGYFIWPVKLINTSIIGNKSSGLFTNYTNCQIENCIFWGNKVSKSMYGGSSSISYSLVQENVLPENSSLKIGEGLIYNFDPQFIDLTGLNFHLKPTSPAIDQGNPDSEYANEPQDNGNRINLGAYGNTVDATQTEYIPRITGLSAKEGHMFGGDTLIIKGTHFFTTKQNGKILFEKTEAKEYLLWSNDSLVCITPPHQPDTVSIYVLNSDLKRGYGFECFAFKPPTIDDVNPFYLSCSGNEQIQITGKLFGAEKNGISILFNKAVATTYHSWNDSVIILNNPPNQEGLTDITFKLNDSIYYTVIGKIYYSNKLLHELCGNIPDTLKRGNAYMLNCPDTIPVNQTLIIESDVLIIVKIDKKNPLSLTVDGVITASGAVNDTIEFLSIPGEKGVWEGIILNNDGTFNYCVIKNAINAIFQKNGTSTIENSRFEENETGIHYYGDNKKVTSQINNCIISNNTVGINAEASGNDSYGKADVEVISSYIANNDGDGIKLSAHGYKSSGITARSQRSDVYCTLKNSIIAGNKGNAIYLHSWGFTFDAIPVDGTRSAYTGLNSYNNLIFNNNKGLISKRINTNSPNWIYAKFYNLNIWNNNTIFEMDADKVFFYNSNLWDNGISGMPTGMCDSLIFESCNVNDLDSVIYGGNNISKDPLYFSAEKGDFSLQPSSPCIDAGSNDFVDFYTDFLDKPRILDGNNDDLAIVDIGALEYITNTFSKPMKKVEFYYSIFPNPTNGIINFRFESNPPKTLCIKLINCLGQAIETRNIDFQAYNQIEQFNLPFLSKGIYLFIISSEKEYISEKIVIQ